MKKLLLNFFIILTLIVSAIPVSAETSANVTVESRQTAAAEITIEGDFTSDAANSEIAIYVFKSYMFFFFGEMFSYFCLLFYLQFCFPIMGFLHILDMSS